MGSPPATNTTYTATLSCFGEAGNDSIYAADGSGLLDGGDGNDNLRADTGNYALVGGAGNDTFEFMGAGSASFNRRRRCRRLYL